jgi:uncharacterized membrane protein YesL
MKRIWPVTWFALRGVYDELFSLAGMGLIWFAVAVLVPYGAFYLTARLFPVIPVVIGAVLISLIPAPPITAALYRVTVEIAHERRIEFGYFWQGFRSYFGLSWKIAGLLLISGAILAVDVVFYLRADNMLFSAIGFLGLWACVFWLAIQLYLFPLMITQEDKRLKLILKNAALLALAFPFFTLGIMIVTALLTTISAVAFLLLVTVWMPFVALLNSRAMVSSLEQVERLRQAQAELKAEE